uniref:Uncharacterized protein n=1 Tax=Picea glauca TaxID=3330 RepID=A0A124GMJ8_PICGL|nr:hypothetical protein ABT39_MTgene2024 [Picea glauca]
MCYLQRFRKRRTIYFSCCRSFTPVMRWPTAMVQLRCFYRVDLSFSVHTTARVQLRWFWLREIGFSVHTTAMANSDGPTAMLLPSRFELFCSYNCDGPTATLLPSQGNK